MKQLFPVLIVFLFAACKQKPVAIKENKIDSILTGSMVVIRDTTNEKQIDLPEQESAIYYLVQVASGHNFDSLKAISSNAVSVLGSKFSMLDRVYKPGKGIIVPENDGDEIYAGEYYPRRPFDDQNFVSIEMASGFCDKEADTLEMVSVAGVYSLKSQADSVATLLKGKIPTVKTIQQEMYLGCMH